MTPINSNCAVINSLEDGARLRTHSTLSPHGLSGATTTHARQRVQRSSNAVRDSSVSVFVETTTTIRAGLVARKFGSGNALSEVTRLAGTSGHVSRGLYKILPEMRDTFFSGGGRVVRPRSSKPVTAVRSRSTAPTNLSIIPDGGSSGILSDVTTCENRECDHVVCVGRRDLFVGGLMAALSLFRKLNLRGFPAAKALFSPTALQSSGEYISKASEFSVLHDAVIIAYGVSPCLSQNVQRLSVK